MTQKNREFWADKSVLITGGAGFLGSFVIEELQKRGANKSNIIVPRSRDRDLRIWNNCVEVVRDKDIVIHLAAVVGGIGFNSECPGTLFYDNALMGIQLMEASRQANVGKFISTGTVCSYPKYTQVPFKEEYLWNGYPEETNAPYGIAKKILAIQAGAYRQQYGFNALHLLIVNLYGPRDNFDLKSSHVIPALIRKFVHAVDEDKKEVEVWGTGKASREFLYVEDAAHAIILAAERYNKPDPINIGAGHEITIKDLVDIIKELTDFSGEIKWNTRKPDGQPRRCLDTTKAVKEFGFTARTEFRDGLKKTIDWYRKNREQVD